jgi:hypothetical protein
MKESWTETLRNEKIRYGVVDISEKMKESLPNIFVDEIKVH